MRGILTETERSAIYESYSTRTIIRAASRISDDAEIVVGSQAIHAQDIGFPRFLTYRKKPTCIPVITLNMQTIFT